MLEHDGSRITLPNYAGGQTKARSRPTTFSPPRMAAPGAPSPLSRLRKSSGPAGTLEVVKDGAALAARAAEMTAGQLKVAGYPFRLVLWRIDTARLRIAQRNRKSSWTAPNCSSAISLLCRRRSEDSKRLPHGTRENACYKTHCVSIHGQAAGHPHRRHASAQPTAMTKSCASWRRHTWKCGVPLLHLTLLGLGDDGRPRPCYPASRC